MVARSSSRATGPSHWRKLATTSWGSPRSPSSLLSRCRCSAGSSKASNKGSMQSKLAALLTLGQDISKLEKELGAKRAKFDSIKASL